MRMDFPLLKGKRGLVVGIANHDSIVTGCARSIKSVLEASDQFQDMTGTWTANAAHVPVKRRIPGFRLLPVSER